MEILNFGDLINSHIKATKLGPTTLNTRSIDRWGKENEIPIGTMRSWRNAGVRKLPVQDWRYIIRLAILWNLKRDELNDLLEAALLPSLVTLCEENESDEDQNLIDEWVGIWASTVPEPRPIVLPPIELPEPFIGRQKLLKQLKAFLGGHKSSRIACLIGMAGVGKTTTAAFFAHELQSAFPDGILWADLSVTEPMTVLLHFAEEFGKDVSNLSDIASRSMRVHSLLAGKRILIVFDNATHESNLHWLVPNLHLCAVIVTTRQLDLMVTQQTSRFYLEPYEPSGDESFAHCKQILGVTEAQMVEPELRQIAEILGHLPLALTLASNRIKLEHDYTAMTYLALLREKDERLNELFEEHPQVYRSFIISFHSLSNDLQTFYCELCAFPNASFSVKGAATIGAVKLSIAQRWLRKLRNLSLVILGKDDRYHLHPLLHDFGNVLGYDDSVQFRLIQYYLDFATQNLNDFKVLRTEESNLIPVLNGAFDLPPTTKLIEVVLSLYYFMRARGLYEPYFKLLIKARKVLAEQDAPRLMADVLVHLGHIALKWGETNEAESYYRQAVSLIEIQPTYPEKDTQLCRLYTSLAAFLHRVGQFEEARNMYPRALALARATEESDRLIAILANLGLLATDHGEYDLATSYFSEAIHLIEEGQNEQTLMSVLLNYGYLLQSKGAFLLADDQYKKGIALAEKYDDVEMKSWLLNGRGTNSLASGDLKRAKIDLAEGQKLAQDLDNQQLLCRYRALDGGIAYLNEDYSVAQESFFEALLLAREGSFKSDICFILIDLANIEISLEVFDQAKVHLDEAFKIAQEANMPIEINRVKFGIARLEHGMKDVTKAKQLAQDCYFTLAEIGNRHALDIEQWLEPM